MKLEDKIIIGISFTLSIAGAVVTAIIGNKLALLLWLVLGIGNDLLIWDLKSVIARQEDLLKVKDMRIRNLRNSLESVDKKVGV